MSCLNDADCKEPLKRRAALGVLGLMLAIFLALSAMSFLPSRQQAVPDEISFMDQGAVHGKRVFQAYNCMGCHTIVGNGAYFGPDLTKVYAHAGPAWLAAFLPSAGGWPTAAAVQAQLQNPAIQADAGAADIAAYRAQYPGAAERIDRRGGHPSLMPNLPLSADEIRGLIAFLKYTSAMDNEGWPPKPKVDGVALIESRRAAARPAAVQTASAAAAGTATAPEDPAQVGARLVSDFGCLACHATDKKRVVGPGWGGLYGSQTTLADGTRVKADEAYLIEAIRHPDAQVVAGYPAKVMPSYDAMINESDMSAIIAYLRSLKEVQK
ncbi:c-type cytochrome [Castellaniella sp. S9]|uniref:c-type cytochrome n=1 Tax=Castellaniella sp. S9 TaxID=2993652 RepID=UPI0022B3E14F|nr:c-type cytochrome [Castellaniella sp. S9]